MMGLEPRGEPLWGGSGVTGASKRAWFNYGSQLKGG